MGAGFLLGLPLEFLFLLCADESRDDEVVQVATAEVIGVMRRAQSGLWNSERRISRQFQGGIDFGSRTRVGLCLLIIRDKLGARAAFNDVVCDYRRNFKLFSNWLQKQKSRACRADASRKMNRCAR